MSGLGDPSGTRLVPMTEPMTRAVVWALHFVQDPVHREALQQLLRAWDASDADSAQLIRDTAQRYSESRMTGGLDFAETVLAALGVPANPANEEHE